MNTGPEWKVLRNDGYAPIPVRGSAVGGYYASPPGEAVDGSRYPWGWEELEALREAGLGERYVEQLAPWRGMLELGLTTVPEKPEPTRSDSHAWSAHPNYGLLATVLGVRSSEPGFGAVRITPHLGSLQRAEGRVPHPRGEIDVRLARTQGGGLRAEVTLPPGLGGVLVWGGQETTLRPGRQDLEF